ncbi:hypothetical protein FGRMN_10143 [Fusarium graminum]|nr:hypothetical protein FGRMN_10143 [Fusarium graminum]
MQPPEEKPGKVRQRRAHTRSRAGCAECRTRRVRCGEQQPTCLNCVKSKRVCEYPPPKIPLRERRALERAGEAQPWEQSPWEVSKGPKRPELPSSNALACQLVLSGSSKMFNVSIDMPFRSRELFHYFYESGITLGISTDPDRDSLRYIISDPDALRTAVLIAGTHFAFNVGSLQAFEPTFLFHRIETLRMVKEWVSGGDPKLIASVTSKVATLAYTEVCRGDIPLAETHLTVIYSVSNNSKDEINHRKTLDEELSDRYFLLTSTFVHGLKSILKAVLRYQGFSDDIVNLDASSTLGLIHKWHVTEGKHSHYLKLKALRLFPAFFSPPHSGATLLDVNGKGIIGDLREATQRYGVEEYRKYTDGTHYMEDEFWLQSHASVFYDKIIMEHLNSISYNSRHSKPDNVDSDSNTSWCGLVVAAQLYIEQVLPLWHPFKKEIYLYSIRILQRELTYAMEKSQSRYQADLMFWESFLGLMSLYAHEKAGELDYEPGFKPFFEKAIWEQSLSLGLHTWADARAVLLRITWSTAFAGDEYVKGIWEAAVGGEIVDKGSYSW